MIIWAIANGIGFSLEIFVQSQKDRLPDKWTSSAWWPHMVAIIGALNVVIILFANALSAAGTIGPRFLWACFFASEDSWHVWLILVALAIVGIRLVQGHEQNTRRYRIKPVRSYPAHCLSWPNVFDRYDAWNHTLMTRKINNAERSNDDQKEEREK